MLLGKKGNEWIAIEAYDNGDGTYNFGVPVDATDLTLVLKGDANMDGVLDTADLQLLSQYLLGENALDDQKLLLLDVNGNGKWNAADKILLARAIADKTILEW
jgi:hypothetical protein